MVGTALVRLALVVCPGRLLGDLDDSAVLAKRLVVVDAVPVICSEPKGWVVLLDLVWLNVVWLALVGGDLVRLDLVWLVAVVRTELRELVPSLAMVDDWLIPVVCCDVVGRTVLPGLVAMLPVPVVCPVEEAVPLVLGVTRLALEVCTEPVDRYVLLTLMGGLPVPVVCPGVVERTLPPVLVACPVPVICSETIEELL